MSEREAARLHEGRWRKSSYSDEGGGSCVEVKWRKSSYSEDGGGSCVEVDFALTTVGLRDSKNADGPELAFDPLAWHQLLRAATNWVTPA
jgi:hypothetical protein